ncbi:uncharacterized protein VICG_02072 [Vittaforma corneae ATCC 50505]|uniref:C3H1-type domain-containing protein n=1 Tax=Vittaforma corneae (strain ATCC 50505) TaxID=993615 RepID=L2GKR8_VITCO|nr:uncharacterized protein VICG_02072 [Vittaforma corneae ATCC 50505]ELA40892.1 hypothetical protein VICG_02072 [Vittaforma corneae ATCC 50505]
MSNSSSNNGQYSHFSSSQYTKQEDRDVEDCYYFLYSTCKRGSNCGYRHNPMAKTNTTLCPQWASTKKCTLDCPMRHSLYHLQKKRSEDFCYFENTEQGCTKPYCEFKHKNPTKDVWKASISSNATNEEYDLASHPSKHIRNDSHNSEASNDENFYKVIEEENRTIDFEIQKIEEEIKRVEGHYHYLR